MRDTSAVVDLVLVLPGGGYNALGPAIRFPTLAAQQVGYEPRFVDYPPQAIQAQSLADVEAAVRIQIAGALATSQVDRIAVIAKSLGTRILTRVPDLFAGIDRLSVVWLTPLFGDADVCKSAVHSGWRSLIVCGRGDSHHDEAGTATVAKALQSTVIELPGADHALEVPGDVRGTISGLDGVAQRVLHFLSP